MNSPLNQIFKSLNSLQEELNEQNKVNVKQKNLEKINKFLLERKGVLSEDFKSQEQNYINQGYDSQIVKTYIDGFRKIKDKNYRQIDSESLNNALKNVRDRRNIDSYKRFEELEAFVDYVKGQVDLEGTSLGKDIEIDAKPIYEDNTFQIYYADSPRACIKYKGNVPYSWCVSRSDSGNMYYTYRYKQIEPTFYFVKVKDRTKKELGFFSMVGNVFNGQFKDTYHFFVVQVIKGAKIGDTTTKQYVVTSAMNDGDMQMSWNDIVSIEPRIANLQDIFKSVPLQPDERQFYNKFKYGTDDETFCKLDYTSKKRYLEIYVLPPHNLLTTDQFNCLPEDLMNLYIGFGVGLFPNQLESIKNNKNLLKRYQQITEKKFEQYLKDTNQNISFNYTEYLILPDNKKDQLLASINNNNVEHFIWTFKEKGLSDINNKIIKTNTVIKGNKIVFFIEASEDKFETSKLILTNKNLISTISNNSLNSILNVLSKNDYSQLTNFVFELISNDNFINHFFKNLDKKTLGDLIYLTPQERFLDILFKNKAFLNKLQNFNTIELVGDKLAYIFLRTNYKYEFYTKIYNNSSKETIAGFNTGLMWLLDEKTEKINSFKNLDKVLQLVIKNKNNYYRPASYKLLFQYSNMNENEIIENLLLNNNFIKDITEVNSNGKHINMFLSEIKNYDKLIDDIFINKEFLERATPSTIGTLIGYSGNYSKIIKKIIDNENLLKLNKRYDKIEFINHIINAVNQKNPKLNDAVLEMFLSNKKTSQEIFELLNDTSKTDFNYRYVLSLISNSKEPMKILNILGDFGRKFLNFITTVADNKDMMKEVYTNILSKAAYPEEIIKIMGNNFNDYFESTFLKYRIRASTEIEKLLQYAKNKISLINLLLSNKSLVDSINKSSILNDIKAFFFSAEDLGADIVKNLLLKYGISKKLINSAIEHYNINTQKLDEQNSPLNEIFNSLNSLQEELTEQRKITIKESNLMKVQNFIKMKRNNQK
jgi:hypothetical protein